jgi:hypothetical protein
MHFLFRNDMPRMKRLIQWTGKHLQAITVKSLRYHYKILHIKAITLNNNTKARIDKGLPKLTVKPAHETRFDGKSRLSFGLK